MSGGVPPSSRAGKSRKGSPRGAKHFDVQRAADLYERFTGHDAESLGKISIPDLPKVAAVIGDCDGVLYTTVRDGKTERYIHEFAKASDKPLLCVTPDGTQLLLIGGVYDFTERGIVDGSDLKTRRELKRR
jgi:hypothetical protein